MPQSLHKVICAACAKPRAVTETTLPQPDGVSRVHLHAVCETSGCAEYKKVIHRDVICSGSPVCGVHDTDDWHDGTVECPGGHCSTCL